MRSRFMIQPDSTVLGSSYALLATALKRHKSKRPRDRSLGRFFYGVSAEAQTVAFFALSTYSSIWSKFMYL
jgi:hypothetical protein